ncbi:MAG: sigma 54-interacting transcriptional regulator [Nannocystaceae bacterium]|nr:sigma 54-interacting transcriptional regulator [Nannocystaceae bacterium]
MKPHAVPSTVTSWRNRFAPDVVGSSPALEFSLQLIERCADTDSTVLITGESGSGKELLARAVHQGSPRAARPFVAVNCAALPETLVESELFGHAKGAYTGANSARAGRVLAAQGGTLFLDEVGDLPLSAQAKLLRTLQEREVTPVGSDTAVACDLRVVAATHRDLRAMVDAGEFRLDLYYRLNVIRVHAAPLRERPEDIVPLAEHFISMFNERAGRNVRGLTPQTAAMLASHTWPGNVRELSNAIERAVVLSSSAILEATALGLEPAAGVKKPSTTNTVEELDLRTAIKKVEGQVIARALEKAGGNRTEAASILGLNRTTLVEKLRKLG